MGFKQERMENAFIESWTILIWRSKRRKIKIVHHYCKINYDLSLAKLFRVIGSDEQISFNKRKSFRSKRFH